MKNKQVQTTTQEVKAILPEVQKLQHLVDVATEERKIMIEYIAKHMIKGTDYGPIHINKSCENKYNCTNKYHFSKDNLTKAGAEKIKDLLRLYPDFKRDDDTWQMAGSIPGLFCYRCILLTQDQKPAGVGLGACDANEKKGNMNNAIKIAKKRAFVDAILTTGSLSDFFTQDMEDFVSDEPMTPRQMAEEKERRAYTDDDGVTHEPYQSKPANVVYATEKQIVFIKKLLAQKGWTEKEVFIKYKVKSLPELLLINAKQIINNLLKLPNKENEESEADQIVEDAAEALG